MSAADKESAIRVDILVIGGGTAGSVAAIKAKEALPDGEVFLLEKANVKRSGAMALGMDGVNNAVVPGHATPEQYVKEITVANDGIVNQRAVLAYARESFGMIQELESWGVKFQKTPSGDYDVKKVHHKGSYVLPMPEGYDIKKILTRVIRQTGVKVENRVMATRILLDEGRAVGAAGFNVRTGAFVVIRAKAVILACGACGRLGLPASGYLMGTYENPANAGDGYAMAYHAGAELTNIEPDGIPPHQLEYKLRRHVNDYLQPPKSAHRLEKGLEYFERAREELGQLGASDPHELMRANEADFIRDCAEMAARASLFRTESRWGLYHHRPEMDDANWFVHVNIEKGADGAMNLFRRPVEPYVVSLDAEELRSYHRLRIESLAA
jgi:succinate dehydrogenase/fumarate reductase flavoprotein subunit